MYSVDSIYVSAYENVLNFSKVINIASAAIALLA